MHIDAIEVSIEGSTGAPYVATFSREGDFLQTACSCPAGEKRIHCKHRLALFAGDLSAVRGAVSPRLAEQLSAMVRGTQVEAALQELEAAEVEAKAAAERVKRAKRFLDRVMHK
jgi:SWIM zinc finger